MITAQPFQPFRGTDSRVTYYKLSEPVPVIDQYTGKEFLTDGIQVSYPSGGLLPTPSTVPQTLVTDFSVTRRQPLRFDGLAGSNTKRVPHSDALAEFLQWANERKQEVGPCNTA